MPGCHSLSLHHRKTCEERILCVIRQKTDNVVRAAVSRVASGKRVQFAAVAHPVAVKMSPHFFLSPTAFRSENRINIGRYRHEPECFRVKPEFLFQDARTVTEERVFEVDAREPPTAFEP